MHLGTINKEIELLQEIALSLSEKKTNVKKLFEDLLETPSDIRNYCLGGVSDLNNNGMPLQLCIGANKENVKLRIIGDPVSAIFQPAIRFNASKKILESILSKNGLIHLNKICNQLFSLLIEENPDTSINDFYRGTCWIGVSPEQPGIALYIDMMPFAANESWDRVIKCLSSLLPESDFPEETINNLRLYAIPASIGFEAVTEKKGRAKVYWRLKHPVQLEKLGIDLFVQPEIIYFLQKVIGTREMNLSGAVFSTGFSLATGELEDVKIDLCGHCLPQSSSDWKNVIHDLTSEFGLQMLPLDAALKDDICDVAFLGMGLTVNGDKRLNLYLKNNSEKQNTEKYPDLSVACKEQLFKAVQYLIFIQNPNGSWADYILPVGTAVDWITAFVGCAMANISTIPGFEEAENAALKAAGYLIKNRSYKQGWGYNEYTGADADSTAWAIKLFRMTGTKITRDDYTFLLKYWKKGGGFTTYLKDNNWGNAHPCVTATAFQVLNTEDQNDRITALMSYIGEITPLKGCWPAYWWKTHQYSTYYYLQLFQELGINESQFYPTTDPVYIPDDVSIFEKALSVGIMNYRKEDPVAACWDILKKQRSDGRWAGGNNLRVTDPDCEKPWENPKGLLYMDYAGTITTATVINIMKHFIL